jgi:hypothetical protein
MTTIKRSELNKLVEDITKKVLSETDYDKTIKNPKTGRDIKLSTALSYDKNSPVYKTAKNMVAKDTHPKVNKKIDKIGSSETNKLIDTIENNTTGKTYKDGINVGVEHIKKQSRDKRDKIIRSMQKDNAIMTKVINKIDKMKRDDKDLNVSRTFPSYDDLKLKRDYVSDILKTIQQLRNDNKF